MILIGVTGSIACYKSCYIVNELVKQDFEVFVVMTESAKEFIKPLTFHSLTGNPVLHNMFKKDIFEYNFPHINVSQEADLFAIVPATANIIGKIASGICDDILSCIAMSTDCPKLIAPAMNENMYKNPLMKENIKKLKRYNFEIISPMEGHLACGYEGMGHLAKEETILNAIKAKLGKE